MYNGDVIDGCGLTGWRLPFHEYAMAMYVGTTLRMDGILSYSMVQSCRYNTVLCYNMVPHRTRNTNGGKFLGTSDTRCFTIIIVIRPHLIEDTR